MDKFTKSMTTVCVSVFVWGAISIGAALILGAESAAGLFQFFSRFALPGAGGLIVCLVVASMLKNRYRGGLLLEFVAAGFYLSLGALVFGVASWISASMLDVLS